MLKGELDRALAKSLFPVGITMAQAAELLVDDVAPFEIYVRSVFPWLNQNQFDALVSLAYNIGVGAFVNSTLLRLLNTGDTQAASAQFAHWIYSNGQKLDGLAARRAAEAELFEQS